MWSRSVAHSLEFMRSHDKSQLRVLAGFRNALCVIFALIVGFIAGQPLAGLAVAIGAQVAGFAGLNGTARKRFRTMLFAAFWMAITSFIGGITGGTWYAILVIAVMGLIAGLLVCVSNEAGLVGLWATIALIFIIGTHEDPLRALMHALLVLAGGLLQTLFMILFDLLQRSNAETEAVADAYFAISDYAKFHSRKADLKVAGALLEADARLRDSFLHAERWKELRKPVDIASPYGSRWLP